MKLIGWARDIAKRADIAESWAVARCTGVRSVSARHSSAARQFCLRYNSEVVQLNARGHSVVNVASEVAM